MANKDQKKSFKVIDQAKKYLDENILEEKLSQQPLSQYVQILKIRIRCSKLPSFIMGYCASDDDTFEKVTDYIREQTGISPLSVLSTSLVSGQFNLKSYFLENLDKLNLLNGEIIMVKARGFERLGGLETQNAYRIAHDYDQDVIEGQSETFRGLKKKVLVVTQIGISPRIDVYERAVKSACQSQFKSFLYEFKK